MNLSLFDFGPRGWLSRAMAEPQLSPHEVDYAALLNLSAPLAYLTFELDQTPSILVSPINSIYVKLVRPSERRGARRGVVPSGLARPTTNGCARTHSRRCTTFPFR